MCALRFLENLERYDSDDSSEDELIARPRIIRERTNYFEELDDVDFFRRFRMKKQTTLRVLQLIEHQLEFNSERNVSVTPINQLLLTLRFYATGSYLLHMGDFSGVSASTCCRIIKRVSEAIGNLRQQFIQFPNTNAQKTEEKRGFYRIAGFPNVVGTIDCTHIKIQNPGGDDGELFRNRKGYFSLNVQTIASSTLKILDVVVRWPGSTHDATIFQNSRICYEFETGRYQNCFLLGDNGYPLKEYLLTPFLHPENAAQANYNRAHILTRNTVERQYGVIKRRFPVLALGLRLKLQTSTSVVVACAVLHNICISENEEQPPDEMENVEELIRAGQMNLENANNNQRYGTARDLIVLNYFNNE